MIPVDAARLGFSAIIALALNFAISSAAMPDDSLDFIQTDTGPDPRFAIVWLHGLGADGHDFEPIVPELGLKVPVRFIFPHAPQQPITINGGMVMRAWYDITAMDINADVDETGIKRSTDLVRALVDTLTENGFSSDRIILAGFSQGGVIALHLGLTYPESLRGILALSTYLALPDTIANSGSEANRNVPIFMGHGTYDPVVPHTLGTQSRDRLKGLNYEVRWHSYPMQHAVNLDEIRDIGQWLNDLLTP